MSKQFVFTTIKDVKIGFLFVDGEITRIHSYEDESLIGNIYVGRISNIVENMNAAFVDIAPGVSCYLSMEDYHGTNKLKIGDLITVQVVKDKIKTKLATVTTNIAITNNYCIIHADEMVGVSAKIKDVEKKEELKIALSKNIRDFRKTQKMKKQSYGGIIRTKAADLSEETFNQLTVTMLCQLDDILDRSKYLTAYSVVKKEIPAYVEDIRNYQTDGVEVITDLEELASATRSYRLQELTFHDDELQPLSARFGLNKIVEKTTSKRVYLKSGGYLIIEPTEAMTVIDVNSGKAIQGKNAQEIQLKLNLEAATEVARQMRLRNLSGIIVVDFINMKNSDYNKKLMDHLKSLALKDEVACTIVDMTKLGLVEITRKKVRKPMHELF